MKRIATVLLALWASATPLKADPAGPPLPASQTTSAPTSTPAASPATSPAVGSEQGNADDFAARMAMDRDESRSAAPARVAAPRPARDAEPQGSGLGSILGMGLSAALIALGLVVAWSQRRLLASIFAPRARASKTGDAALPAAAGSATQDPRVVAAALAARFQGGKTAGTGRSAPALRAGASSVTSPADAESLRQLATELRQMMAELKAERARWERDWEEREMKWYRARRQEEAMPPAFSASMGAAVSSPAVVAELEGSALPGLAGAASGSDEPGLLTRVERMLQQGLSAEEVSRRLRVGLREIQWMMRMGAVESR